MNVCMCVCMNKCTDESMKYDPEAANQHVPIPGNDRLWLVVSVTRMATPPNLQPVNPGERSYSDALIAREMWGAVRRVESVRRRLKLTSCTISAFFSAAFPFMSTTSPLLPLLPS